MYIFAGIRNPQGPYQAATFCKQMKKVLASYESTAGIRFRSHDYRHTIATDLHAEGASIAVVRAFLGHKNTNMTRQYIDETEDEVIRLQRGYLGGIQHREDVIQRFGLLSGVK